jgi:hypothetical protein
MDERAAEPPAARSTRVEPGQEVDLGAYNKRWHQVRRLGSRAAWQPKASPSAPATGVRSLRAPAQRARSRAPHPLPLQRPNAQIWGAGLQPGERFDAGASPPLLRHLLGSGRVPVAGRRVLVPGCGRGWGLWGGVSV